MAADIQNVVLAFGVPQVPPVITQEPFDDDPSHYNRLCSCGANPDNHDLCRYAEDLQYQDIQVDLFQYLLPVCLSAWQKDLMASHKSAYLGFVEHFVAAQAKRHGFRSVMTPSQHTAVSDFMWHTILDKIDLERELSFSGMGSSPYSWIRSICSYGTAFPSINDLWSEWWNCCTVGRAYGVLQYASVLMYPDNENPVFAVWTPENGGGAPSLWETSGHIYDQAWLPENVTFLQSTFTPDFLQNSVSMAARLLRENTTSPVPELMAADCDARAAFVECRIEELIMNLSLPLGEVRDWLTT